MDKWRYRYLLTQPSSVTNVGESFGPDLVGISHGDVLIDILQDWGDDGWELVSVAPTNGVRLMLVFKKSNDVATRMAEAVEAAVSELREDHVLRVRPHLVFRHRGVTLGVPRAEDARARIENVGIGAAIHVHYAAYSRGKADGKDYEELGFGAIDAVGRSSYEETDITYPGDPVGLPLLDGYLNPDFPTWTAEIAVCRDVMGNWYRFIRGRGAPHFVANADGPPPWGRLVS